jgi:hypothetical protein
MNTFWKRPAPVRLPVDRQFVTRLMVDAGEALHPSRPWKLRKRLHPYT